MISKRVAHVFIHTLNAVHLWVILHICTYTLNMCTLWSACTVCGVMHSNAMPCLATYVYIFVDFFCLVQRLCASCSSLFCLSSRRAGCSAWHLRPSTLRGERSEHGWRPLFLGPRSSACFANCKWFSIQAHFRINYLEHVFTFSSFQFFSSESYSEADYFALQTAARLLEQLGLRASGPSAADLVAWIIAFGHETVWGCLRLQSL